jgi:2'-hydroxyisoflavone reductase
VLAPGARDRPLQYIDARDLARWLLDAATTGAAGAYNVVARRGHATMGTLLETARDVTGSDATLTWVDPGFVAGQGIEGWSELPIWLPPDHEYAGMHAIDVERAHAAGLTARPLQETIRDTWEWLAAMDLRPPLRPDLPPPGTEPGKERTALAAWHAARA